MECAGLFPTATKISERVLASLRSPLSVSGSRRYPLRTPDTCNSLQSSQSRCQTPPGSKEVKQDKIIHFHHFCTASFEMCWGVVFASLFVSEGVLVFSEQQGAEPPPAPLLEK